MFDKLATPEEIKQTIEALKNNNVEAELVINKAMALARIKELIPKGASVMNGASVTLEEIGFVDFLKSGEHGWNNLHEAIVAEEDPTKQSILRKQALLSDYYLGSVHALTQNGIFVVASNTGSQLPHIAFSSQNLLLVVGAQKIVRDLDQAMERLNRYVIPLEDKHMLGKYGVHTYPSKVLIFNRENPVMGRSIRIILVKEKLGF